MSKQESEWALNQVRRDALILADRNGFSLEQFGRICRNRFEAAFEDMTLDQLHKLCAELRELKRSELDLPALHHDAQRIPSASESRDLAQQARAQALGVPAEIAEQEGSGERLMASQRSASEQARVDEALGR